MWLERFSGQSAQQAAPAGGSPNRSFSPAPRKPIQLGPSTPQRRPGLSTRTSSLGALAGSGSADSLPPAVRIPNGTNLRRELNGSPAQDAQDPLDVLQRIIGAPREPRGGDERARGANVVFDESGEDIDFGGMSLEEFVNGVDPPPAETTTENHLPLIEDFEKEKNKFEDLHKSITECDGILSSVETYLTSFQADLAAVSAEIETLQNRSTSLNTKLQNRKVVERVLGPEVAAFSIPPGVVRKIAEGTVDDAWVRALDELDKKSRSIDAKAREGRDIKAAQDVKPFIEDLSDKAVERIRDYVVAQIKALRSPSINAQIIQQNAFARYKGVFAFLAQRQPGLADDISHAYINTMRWYYVHNFTRYRSALDKLHLHVIDVSETIAADPAKRVARPGPTHDAFSIGRRMEMLRTTNDAALSSYVAEENRDYHYLELPFRAFGLALIDNASAEYSFLADFFAKQPINATTRRFNDIFHPTFELGHALTRHLIEQSQDAIGVLLCVRLNQRLAFELQRRKVPAVEGYVNATNMLLWPRFQIIIDAHCESMRKLTASLPGKPPGSALSLTSSPAATQSTAPHPLTQRFANFSHAILSLSSEAGDDEPVSNSLLRLRNEFDAFLTKLSKSIADAKKRTQMLNNNYSLVGTILTESEGKFAEEFRRHFVESKESLSLAT